MPKVSLVSDLHLELAEAPALKGGDILLLAGDILTAAHIENRGAARRRLEAFCKKELKKYGLIFFVHGNHEYYGSTLEVAPRIIEEFLDEHAPQTIVLDNASHTVGGVCFIGSTLWASHGVGQPGAELIIGAHLADFREIRFGDRLPSRSPGAHGCHSTSAPAPALGNRNRRRGVSRPHRLLKLADLFKLAAEGTIKKLARNRAVLSRRLFDLAQKHAAMLFSKILKTSRQRARKTFLEMLGKLYHPGFQYRGEILGQSPGLKEGFRLCPIFLEAFR